MMIWELRFECLMMMVNKNLTELSWIFFKNLILILIEQRNHSFSIFFPFTNIIRLVDLICLSWIYGFETMQKTAKAMLWTHAMHWIDVQVKYAVVKKSLEILTEDWWFTDAFYVCTATFFRQNEFSRK